MWLLLIFSVHLTGVRATGVLREVFRPNCRVGRGDWGPNGVAAVAHELLGTGVVCSRSISGRRLSPRPCQRRLRLSLLLYRLHGLTTEFSEYCSAIVGSWPSAATIGDSRCRAHTGVTGGIGDFFWFAPRFLFIGSLLLGRAFLLGGLV